MGQRQRPELADTLAAPDTPPASTPALAATVADTDRGAPSAEPELTRGAVVGRYIVLGVLGAGGMGVVYAAYDPDLDRRIALKLVRDRVTDHAEHETEGRARMLREAQAIAKLSHPNVVAIHDVGTTAGGDVFLAMELVEGPTLGAWLRERARPIADILDVFVQAGRGLAAAHRAGLVHRDFKPENVLIGKEGRARVADFGLVRRVERPATAPFADTTARPSEPMLMTELTQVGTLLGTPMYMAPEQLERGAADARTDQYSFCVAMFAALYGEPPFQGTALDEVRPKVLAGEVVEPATARRVPAHVRAAIRRGMAVDRERRFASMEALLDAVTHDPSARRRRWIAAAAAVVVVGAGLAIAVPRLRRGDAPGVAPCGGAADRLAGAWDPARRAALRRAFEATHAPYAAVAFDAAARGLDRYAAAWIHSYEDSCRATHVRGEQSLAMLDLRTACLRRRRTELATLVGMLGRADAHGVSRAHAAVSALSPVADCDDLTALQAPVKPPAGPAAAAVEALRDDIARARAIFLAGKFKAARTDAEALVGRARALGYRPVEAEAGQLLGWVQSRTGDAAAARASDVAALGAATASGHDELAARLAMHLVQVAANLREFAYGRDWAAIAEALVERLGDAPARRAALHHVRGYLAAAQGKYAVAAEEHEQARQLRERIAPGSDELARSLNSLAFAYDELGRYAEARAVGERSLALQQAELGATHPEIATVLLNLGNIAADEGALALATDYYERALAIRERSVVAGDDPSGIADVVNNLGIIAFEQGRHDDALALHHRALALREQIDPAGPDVTMSLVNIAAVQRRRGELAAALATNRRALAIAEAAVGPDHPYVGDALVGIGACLEALHRPAEAQPVLERALAIRAKGSRPVERADAELALARALWARGHRDRAVRLARSARTAYAGSPATRRQLAEADAWLRDHGAPATP